MTTLVLLVALLAPLIGTAVGALRPATAVARACVLSTAGAAIAALVLLAAAAASDSGVPAGLVDLSDWLEVGIDRTTAVLLVATTATALVVASFSRRSLDADHPRTAGYYLAVAAVTTGSALVVVPSGPIPLLIGWVVSGRALVHLTRGWADGAGARAAHRRLSTSVWIGDLALSGAIAVAVAVAGPTLVLGHQTAVDDLASSTVFGVDAGLLVALLVVAAGAARSALVPFHRWLTATLHAPTPVSALVHAGFVSGAGLLLIRFAPTFTASRVAVVVAVALATVTLVIGTSAALVKADAKGSLAWSTVAQMAFMVLQASVGALAGAVVHIVGHGMYKAAQFLGVGDTVASGLRKRRNPIATEAMPGTARVAATIAISTTAVAAGVAVGPSGLERDEAVLLVAFAWAAIAAAVDGTLRNRSLSRIAAITTAVVGSVVAGVGYFVAVDLAKRFLGPSLAPTEVAVEGTAVVVVAVVAATAVLCLAPGSVGDAWRSQWRWWIERVTAVRAPLDLRAVGVPASRSAADDSLQQDPATHDLAADDRTDVAHLQAQVARAAEIIAPTWPLASFVAVNPLTGLENRSFDDGTAVARRWLHAQTHRTLDGFRADHDRGLTTTDDVAFVAHDVAMVACAQPSVDAPGRRVDPIEVVLADLLHGPEAAPTPEPRTALERRLGVGAGAALGIDDLVGAWLASYVAPPSLPLTPAGGSIVGAARAQTLRHARRQLSSRAVAWIEALPDEPALILDEALEACAVRPIDRVDEIRGHLAQVPGWTGLARWRTEWAHPDEPSPPLRPIDIAAIRAMLEAAVLTSIDETAPTPPVCGPEPMTVATMQDDLLDRRVVAAVERLELPDDAATRGAVSGILALVPESMRVAIWQRAQERHVHHELLSSLDRGQSMTAAPLPRPAAQVVFCIDVRSEGLRRHLEAQGSDATLGFAGFFGVPVKVRELGWPAAEARCPVLVSPSVSATEHPLVERIPSAARRLTRDGLRGAVAAAHAATKHLPGAAFAAAETLGWLLGPRAAWKTLARPGAHRHRPTTATRVRIGDDLGYEQRLFAAESVLRTMGLTERFSELVVLCGHTSVTVNNAHATALECGACAGASGATNARAVAGLLNEPDVRTGLARRGIEIPDDTWFTAAVHDTASDAVTILDRHLAPTSHHAAIDALERRLEVAGVRQAADRAVHLPGPSSDVRTRGHDWAQVRPEWGLAANAAFVIGPRSMTAELDLEGRAFLHSYEPTGDPDGRVLEAIMTAPLVVGHWISAQYYFSTVDPERFGAGDKLLHNPIGRVGVVSGAGGDLRVGLPIQSTRTATVARHQPLRLLAVVQADVATVESIISRNPVLDRLTSGSWLHVAARSGPDAPWSMRSPGGTWSQLPGGSRPDGLDPATLNPTTAYTETT